MTTNILWRFYCGEGKRAIPYIMAAAAICGSMNARAARVFNLNDGMPAKCQSMPCQERILAINPALYTLNSSNMGDTLLLDFFEDAQYKAVIQNIVHDNDGIVGITAQIVHEQFAYCFISLSKNACMLAADLPLRDMAFGTHEHDGRHYLHRGSMPRSEPCQHSMPAGSRSHASARQRAVPSTLPENTSPVTIDLMVLYTAAAKNVIPNIDNAIGIGLQRSNLSMQNSNTGVTFRIVHKQEIDYTESGNVNTDLQRLRGQSDGYADDVHALRARHAADMVLVLIGNAPSSNVLGAGFIMGSEYGHPATGFSVMQVRVLPSDYTMIHELGHNFGCGHHTDVDYNSLYSYSHGYRGISTQNTKFSTIMTYQNTTGTFYGHIPYFSDPAITFEGTAVGAADANNAKTIRQTKTLVEQYSNELPLTDAFLSGITISAGTLQPSFNAGVRNYSVVVPNSTAAIDVAGIANSPQAIVTGNVSGYALSVGNNVVQLEVEDAWGNYAANNGGSNNKYTITITRSAAAPSLPRDNVVFPTAAAITYSPSTTLSNVRLNNGSGDGVFAWANPAAVPTPANSGYEVVFTPRDPNAYDYTGVVMRKVVQLVVNKANQTITFPAIPAKTYGDAPFMAGASASSGLTINYASSNSSAATISAAGMVTIVGAGTTTITASQAGNANYNAASVSSRTFTINKANQNITFPAMQERMVGDAPFMAGASASSGLTINYASSNSSAATISAAGMVTIVGAGTTTITASQAGNANYNAASAQQTLRVKQRPATTPPAVVVFPTAAAITYSPSATLSNVRLNNGSGDGVFAWANPAAVPTPANSGYEVVFTPRDPNAYDYTGVVMRKVVQLVVNKANQTITFPAIPAKTYGDAPFSAQASVNTGLPLTYSSSNSRIAAISASGMITILGAGRVTIVAQHSGNSNYNAAIQSRILTIKAAAATDVPVQAADGGIAVYPNPAAAGMLYIGGDFAGMVQIYTLSGSLAAVSAGAAISVAHLPSGIYIVRTGSKAAKILIINN